MKLEHLNSIYRNYDIRGQFPNELTEDEVEKIGKALVDIYSATTIVIGYDNRPSTEILYQALTRGITSQGANVVHLGQVTSPMLYMASSTSDAEVAIMITASHMPSQYNGLKICIEDALPLGLDSGLAELRDYVKANSFKKSKKTGSTSDYDIKPRWKEMLQNFVTLDSRKSTKVVIDPANSVGVLEIESLTQYGNALEVTAIFDELDYTCPNHEANPMKLETLEALSQKVVETGSAIGIALDTDADRIGIVDENGTPVPQDMIGVLVAEELLVRHGQNVIIHDVRSSRRVKEVVERQGGISTPGRIGHTYMRRQMRDAGAIFALELSGHHYFRDTHYSEGGILPALLIIEIMRKANKKLSELVAIHQIYAHTGEINSDVKRTPEEIYLHLKESYPNASIEEIDGLTIIFDHWWCNVRPSANDPVIRLNLEADTHELMEEKKVEVLKIIRE